MMRRREPPYSFEGNSPSPSPHCLKKGVGRGCESLCEEAAAAPRAPGGEGKRGSLRYLLGPRPSRRMQAALAELAATATLG